MPMTTRPYDREATQGRKSFRSITDFKRARGTGEGQPFQKSTRPAPPEYTSAENFYYIKQMNSRTPMVIVLTDGEEIRGCIEWYDRSCLKVNRDGAPNLVIQKHSIKYLFKQEEESRSAMVE
jgi:sRNA-binding regulator protein Hfq